MAEVDSELRDLNDELPDIIHLEERELQRALQRRGCYADLVTVASARGWLLGDLLEIKA